MKNTKVTTFRKFKVLGFNDEYCSCMICGKEELKGTYALQDTETGEIIRAGSTCGAKAAGWKVKELNIKLKEREVEIKKLAKDEFWNSDEYIAYAKASKYMNDKYEKLENELYHLITWASNPSIDRINELKALKDNFMNESWDYLDAFDTAKKRKEIEICKKYGLKYL